MSLLITVRHGQSTWNLENRFTGLADVDLSEQGIQEAHQAGAKLRTFKIDKAFVSTLRRAIHTLEIILEETKAMTIPVVQSAALNERNYGDLQGLNKSEMENKYGAEQVLIWRRGYDSIPPGGESLKQTYERAVPYFQQEIEPFLRSGRHVLMVSHGNTLRALAMYLEDLSPAAIAEVSIATGVPRIYSFNPAGTVDKAYYL